MKPYDANEQTALDMTFARNRTSITVGNVRNYLYRELLREDSKYNWLHNSELVLDGRDAWERRRNIIDILRNEPVFNKSQRWAVRTSAPRW